MFRTVIALFAVAMLGTAAHAKAPSKADAAAAQKILDTKVPDYFGNSASKTNDFGIVTILGKPTLATTARPNIIKASLKFNGNMLWGGSVDYKVAVKVNLNSGLIRPIGRPVGYKTVN